MALSIRLAQRFRLQFPMRNSQQAVAALQAVTP
jgi:hypothetical protein